MTDTAPPPPLTTRLREMKPGDSILVDHRDATSGSIWTILTRLRRREGMRFTCKSSSPGSTRVWKLEP